MQAAEYLFIAWATLSFYRISTVWWALEMPKIYLVFSALHLAAITGIIISHNYLIGLTISAFTNIVFYWWAKPKFNNKEEFY